MIPYFAIAALTPSLVWVSERIFGRGGAPAKLRWIVLSPFEISAVALLVLFMGLRYGIGTDYELYSRIYARIDTGDWAATLASSPQEWGFTLLSLAIKSSFDSPQAFFLAVGGITVVSAYIAIRLLTDFPSLSIAAYILFASYLLPFNTMRQGLAIAFVLLAVAVYPRSRILSATLAALAVSMHTSAIIALILIALARYFKPGKASLLLAALLATAASVVLTLFPSLVGVFAGPDGRYGEYLETAETAGVGTVLVGSYHLIMAVLLLRISMSNREQEWLRSIYMFSAPLTFLGLATLEMARLGWFFSIALAPLAPALVSSARNPMLARVALLAVGAAYMLVYLLNYGGLLPYDWTL